MESNYNIYRFNNNESNQQYKQTRKRKLAGDKRSNRKVWSSEEVSAVLEYVKNTMLSCGKIETPNAKAYYKQLLEDFKIDNCDETSLINKMRKLREGFWKAVQLKEELRLRGGGSETYIHEEVLKQCENFDILKEIYGSTVTYIDEKPVISSTNTSNFSDSEYDEIFENDSSLGDPLAVESIQESIIPLSGVTSKPPAIVSQIPKQPPEMKDRSLDFVFFTQKEDEIQKGDIEWEKFVLEKEKLKFAKEMRLKEIQIEERKCATEERSAKAEIDFRKELLAFEREKFLKEKEVELEKFKIEQDVKLKIEMSKLKNN